MSLRKIIQRAYVRLLEKSSDKRKIKFLRGQGMKIGEKCHLNTMSFSSEPYLIEIGNHVAIAAGTDFITHDGAIWCFREELENGDIFGKIKIGNNVFIGNNCTILPGTSVGDNCIIGAGSTVRGQFPDNSVIIGNPAKVMLTTNMQKLLYLQNPGFIKTRHLPYAEKTKIIKGHFDIK
jgi:acetyltransferase-like isoleucine patch superfamily enzyme